MTKTRARSMVIAVITAMLAIVAAMAISACSGGKQQAIDAYLQASDNLKGNTDLSMQSNYDLNLSVAGQSVSCSGDFNLAYALPTDSDDLLNSDAAMDLSMVAVVPGSDTTDVSMSLYLKDRTLYMNVPVTSSTTEKLYSVIPSDQQASMEELLNEMNSADTSTLPKFEDYVTDGSISNGNITLKFDTISYIKDMLASESASLGTSTDTEEIDTVLAMFDGMDTTITASVNPDMQFTSWGIDMTAQIDGSAISSTTSGYTYDVDATYDITSIEINTGKAIQFPDFSDYVESDSLEQSLQNSLAQSVA